MNSSEYKILAEQFGTPCDWGPIDDYMTEHADEFCGRFCGKIDPEQCWRKWFKLKIAEHSNS